MAQRYRVWERGFVPFIIIAIVALVAIGGGVYAVKKNNEKKAALQDNVDTQANANADANANVNANLGVGANANAKLKGTFSTLLNMRENKVCTFEGTNNGVTSEGTVYISAEGNMNGDFTTTRAGVETKSNLIVKSGTAYVWSGSQGAKISLSTLTSSTNAQVKNYMDVNSGVDYSCKDWTPDSSKFNLPSGITFVDIDAMLKGGLQIPGTNQ